MNRCKFLYFGVRASSSQSSLNFWIGGVICAVVRSTAADAGCVATHENVPYTPVIFSRRTRTKQLDLVTTYLEQLGIGLCQDTHLPDFERGPFRSTCVRVWFSPSLFLYHVLNGVVRGQKDLFPELLHLTERVQK